MHFNNKAGFLFAFNKLFVRSSLRWIRSKILNMKSLIIHWAQSIQWAFQHQFLCSPFSPFFFFVYVSLFSIGTWWDHSFLLRSLLKIVISVKQSSKITFVYFIKMYKNSVISLFSWHSWHLVFPKYAVFSSDHIKHVFSSMLILSTSFIVCSFSKKHLLFEYNQYKILSKINFKTHVGLNLPFVFSSLLNSISSIFFSFHFFLLTKLICNIPNGVTWHIV